MWIPGKNTPVYGKRKEMQPGEQKFWGSRKSQAEEEESSRTTKKTEKESQGLMKKKQNQTSGKLSQQKPLTGPGGEVWA